MRAGVGEPDSVAVIVVDVAAVGDVVCEPVRELAGVVVALPLRVAYADGEAVTVAGGVGTGVAVVEAAGDAVGVSLVVGWSDDVAVIVGDVVAVRGAERVAAALPLDV